jgi:D-alanyl-D-alanine dipeptidase
MGFSPDAEFPIINGEKGNVTFQINFTGDNGGTLTLANFDAGIRANMVPGIARAVVTGDKVDKIAVEFNKFLQAQAQVTGNAEVDEAGAIKLEVHGKQVHGAMPHTGVNAGTYLAHFLSQFDFGGSAAHFLAFLGGPAHESAFGEGFALEFEDDVMGKLSLNVGIQKFVDGQDSLINVNLRFPKGMTPETIQTALNDGLNGWDVEVVQQAHTQAPHYVSPDDALVKTLLNIYHEQTGLPAHDQVIGGGTYGRLMTRGVAYGALFPDSPDTMHQVNEFALVDDLTRAISIYAQAIAELGNLD